ncbi:unnamed protein product [Lasius platythorax]|uniref:BRISC complex subunit FAM175B helical domain-containing protein n=1 Tax=Lasius platythorax TaxID=488582 RepID=A0AAV2N2R4_9HYME
MADSDLLVTISGAALSLLFFENVRSIGDQMGFLLGEALEFIVKTYTDSDNQVETVKIHINVEAIVTCPLPDLLHDYTNRINTEKLKDFVRDKSKQVIGWFRFRRNTTNLTLTVNDKILHKQFASHFSGGNGCKEDFFLTCLLSASTSETSGTHKFRHVFLRRNKREIFEPISLRINNLGDDASRHDGSDYKPTPVKKSTRTPDGFTKLIESLNLDVARIGGLDSAMLIQRAAEQHLTSLIPKVCESDLEVAELERQVHELKTKIAAQKFASMKVNGENCDRISKAQSVTPNNRIPSRNTAACIAKSAEKSRRLGRNNSQESGNQETQNSTNSRRSGNFIPEIATEPICQEGSEISMGRGRGSGRGSHEFMPGMKKIRRIPGTSHMHSSRERSATPPEQDFSDAECPATPVSRSSPVLRSYSQVTKKTNLDKCNTMAPFDI